MYRGRKCFFVNKNGCSIYSDRPENPCKTYLCAWLTDDKLPEWLKPSESNVICTWRYIAQIDEKYLEIIECDQKMSVEILSWIIHFYVQTKTTPLVTFQDL
jgi:Fe-S-cluster containining protein